MQTYYFYENGTRLIAQYRSGSKAIALKYFAKSFPRVYRRGNFTVTTTNGRAVNPRTLVSAKLQRMPNGTIKVLVSPGAMAKMRVGNPAGHLTLSGRESAMERTVYVDEAKIGTVRYRLGSGLWEALDKRNVSHGDRYTSSWNAAKQLALGLGIRTDNA